jgi:hypothetical protein
MRVQDIGRRGRMSDPLVLLECYAIAAVPAVLLLIYAQSVLLECYAIAAVPAVLLLIYAQSRYNRRRERR